MRHLTALTAVALLALPLVADEAKPKTKTSTTKTQTQSAPPAEPRAVQAPAPTVEDSPLVAAAKRANRLGKTPKFVITSETLVTSGGHFTTTEQQYDVSNAAPPPPTQAELAARRSAEARQRQMRVAAEAAKQREQQAAQERMRLVTEAADAADDAYETEDPTRAESMAEEAAKKLQEQKPPHR